VRFGTARRGEKESKQEYKKKRGFSPSCCTREKRKLRERHPSLNDHRFGTNLRKPKKSLEPNKPALRESEERKQTLVAEGLLSVQKEAHQHRVLQNRKNGEFKRRDVTEKKKILKGKEEGANNEN